MARIEYLDDFQSRVLESETSAGKPVKIQLGAPSLINAKKHVTLKIAALDINGFPARLDEEVEIVLGGKVLSRVKFSKKHPAVAAVSGIQAEEKGFLRFTVKGLGREFYANPAWCGEGVIKNIYWGDPHIHTVLSRCQEDKARSLNFCYAGAKYLSGLDWASAADHVSNGRCDFAAWKEESLAFEHFNKEGAFVTLPAYEASLRGGAGGDNNIYFTRAPCMFDDECEGGTLKILADKLKKKSKKEKFDFGKI